MLSKKLKFTLILGGLALSFLILEVGLRLTGYLMISAREVPLGQKDRESFLLAKNDTEKIRIMAIGDSTTNGGTLPLQDTYPFMLYDLIQESEYKDKVTVANHGRCEYNSSMTLNQIKHELDDYDPHVVLLLTGEADRFNPLGLEEELEGVGSSVKLESFLLNFRVYKLIRGLIVNLTYKYIVKDNSMYSNDDFAQNQKNIEHMFLAFDLAQKKKFDLAKKELAKVIPPIPDHLMPKLKKNLISDFGAILEYPQVSQLSYMIGKQQYADVVSLSMEYLKGHPYALYDENRDGVIYSLFWALDFQSDYSAQELLVEVLKLGERFPQATKKKPYLNFVRRLKNYDKIMKVVDQRREKNIEEMLKLFKEKNIEVLVLNYPAEFTKANQSLLEQARKNNLEFVDLRSHFKKLIERDGRGAWLLDDEHPTVKGNSELAKKVLDKLKPILQKKIKPENKKKTMKFKITAWDGYTPSHVIEEFKKQILLKYGVDLDVEIFLPENEEQMYNKLLNNEVHVMAASHYLFRDPLYQYFPKKLLRPIDLEKISNYKNLYRPFKNLSFEKNNGEFYGVPLAHAAYRLVYNKAHWKTPPSSWSVLFDPRNDGTYTVSSYYFETNNYIAALVAGIDRAKLHDHNFYKNDIKNLLKELAKGSNGYWGNLEKPNDIKGRKVAAAFGNFIHKLKEDGEDWGFAIPKEGEPAYLDYFVISSMVRDGSLLSKVSHEWVNFSLTPFYQMEVVVKGLGEMPVTEDIKESLTDEQIKRFHLDDPDYIGTKSFFWKARSLETLKWQEETWNKAIEEVR
ncbi:MAG: hypothetical protein CME70_23585 [Halobacteriovorax sp.]|nr:hypothetical protein [Halobacteriovorax sp.]|tara:strand:+ start:160630 stop:163014 length:2385 start_codon:yes stop_codon:yes gene_type:complete